MTMKSRRDEVVMWLNSQWSGIRRDASLGSGFNGKRDYYTTLGYELNPTTDIYYAYYSRNELAGAIVDIPAGATWGNAPVIIDGNSRSDSEEKNTSFTKEIISLNKNASLFSTMWEADKILGYSTYAVIFLGVGGKLDQPVTGGAVEYMQSYDDLEARVNTIDEDSKSPRFKLPLTYKIKFDATKGSQERIVHWTRCIHIKRSGGGSRIKGVPFLERPLNRVFDWEKVIGGSSEAFWLHINRGLAILSDPEFDTPVEGEDGYEELMEKLQDYTHQINRIMTLDGVKDIKDLGADAISSKDQKDVLLSAASIATGIPKRLLEGSEVGNLASTQDRMNWADKVKIRQETFAEPAILRATIDQLVAQGNLSKPSGGDYKVEWMHLFTLTEDESADVLLKLSESLFMLTGELPENVTNIKLLLETYAPRAGEAILDLLNPVEEDLIEEDDADDEDE